MAFKVTTLSLPFVTNDLLKVVSWSTYLTFLVSGLNLSQKKIQLVSGGRLSGGALTYYQGFLGNHLGISGYSNQSWLWVICNHLFCILGGIEGWFITPATPEIGQGGERVDCTLGFYQLFLSSCGAFESSSFHIWGISRGKYLFLQNCFQLH